nr:MAG TPA: membrane-bound lytic murein transglycosylase D [Herelleviridae sp.]
MLFKRGLIRINNRYYHKVSSNETLWEISKKYGVDVQELQRLNNMKSVSTQGKSLVMVFRKPVIHEVEDGDTLDKISKEYGVSVEDIKKYNGLSPDTISVGDYLIVDL